MANMSGEVQIPVTIGGVTFKNPFFVASGPTTKSVRQLVRIEETGWAAASIKLSIDPAPYINRRPRYSLFKDRDALAFTAEKRLTFAEGLRLVSEAKPLLHDLKLMANITYAGDDGVAGWVNMAQQFEKAGADIIELNMCCPNMSYNVEMTSGGSCSTKKQTGASMGQQADMAADIVRAVKQGISIPLFVKLTPEGGKVAQVAKAVYEAGADAVGSTGNRLGMPPIDIDSPGSAFYHLQKEISMGCHCGKWLKPLAQRDTYEMRKMCGDEMPIIAAGGITNWHDAVEMILCGGTLLGVCAETLISGYDIVRPMVEGLHSYMEKHGYTDLAQVRSKVVPQMRTATDVTLYDGYARVKDPNLSAPCKSACPHHVPTQAYIQKISKGEYREAYDLITEKNPLQSLCALVCTHPCEDACIRGGYDTPVKIRQLKRFVLEYGRSHGWKPAWAPHKANGHRVAVVGAGPAGLACAAQLCRGGYAVTVFEKQAVGGGMLAMGTPAYRMSKKVLSQEIQLLHEQGVEFRFQQTLGENFTLKDLKQEGFERVFVAVGRERKKQSDIPGAQLAYDALELSSDINNARTTSVTQHVVVAGRGFMAMDAARSLVRLGVNHVTLLWTGINEKSSVWQDEMRMAQEEGVMLLQNVQVKRIETGRVYIAQNGVDLEIGCEQVVLANEYEPNLCGLDGLETQNGSVKTRQYRTNDPFVYAGGAAVREGNVIAAITSGKNAAAEIDRDLQGEAAVLKAVPTVKTVDAEKVRQRIGYLKRDRGILNLSLPEEQRKTSFDLYERVMTEEEAKQEASRCLNCGCGEGCQLCKTICTDFAPEIVDTDTVQIRREMCVACGMCYNRCPNGNIGMVNLGKTV